MSEHERDDQVSQWFFTRVPLPVQIVVLIVGGLVAAVVLGRNGLLPG